MDGLIDRQEAADSLGETLAAAGLGGEIGEITCHKKLRQGPRTLGGQDSETGVNV